MAPLRLRKRCCAAPFTHQVVVAPPSSHSAIVLAVLPVQSDLCLAMGSSLTVTPAADVPETVGDRDGADLVVVNLQSTPLDSCATLRINAKCDDVMVRLAEILGITIPQFRLRRYVKVATKRLKGKLAERITVTGNG